MQEHYANDERACHDEGFITIYKLINKRQLFELLDYYVI